MPPSNRLKNYREIEKDNITSELMINGEFALNGMKMKSKYMRKFMSTSNILFRNILGKPHIIL